MDITEMRTDLRKIGLTKLFLNFLFKFGSALGLCPFRWDNNGEKLTVVDEFITFPINFCWMKLKLKSYKCWLVYYGGIILTRIGYLAFIIYRAITLEVTRTEGILTCLYVAFSIMGVTDHIYYRFNVKGITAHVNQLVTLNRLASKTKFTWRLASSFTSLKNFFLAKLLRIQTNPDVLSHLNIVCYAYVIFMVGTSVGMLIVTIGTYRKYQFFRFFNLNGNMFMAIGFGTGLMLDLLVSFVPVGFMFLHLGVTTHWLQMCQKTW